MKPSEVYLMAAEKVQREHGLWGCCDAINWVVLGHPTDAEAKETRFFTKLYKPSGSPYLYWFGQDWNVDPISVTRHRVIALLLMSEIAKDKE